MKIKSITIRNYKSVKEVSVDVTARNFPYTFIGKNGSGKSNVLEAISKIFRMRLTAYEETEYVVRGLENSGFTVQLNPNERQEYAGIINFDQQTGEIFVGGRNTAVEYIGGAEKKYPCHIYRQEILRRFGEYGSLLKKFKESLAEAEKYLQDCRLDGRNDFFEITNNFEGNAEDISDFLYSGYPDCQRIAEFFDRLPKEGITPTDFLRGAYFIKDDNIRPFANCEFKINDPGLLSPAAEKYLGKSAEDVRARHAEKMRQLSAELKEQFKGIKKEHSAICKAAADCKKEFEARKKEFLDSQKDGVKKYNKFIGDLQKLPGQVYFLDYETAINFTDKRSQGYENARVHTKFSCPEDVIYKFLIERGLLERGENFSTVNKGDGGERLQKIEHEINGVLFKNILPDFDRDEVSGLEFKFIRNKTDLQYELFVKEKSGHETPFGETSLGRRWYICYKLIKSILKRDDILILDEPASTLHPAATDEIRRELDGLAESGVRVFLATHSPYMFPEDFKNIINVEMTAEGTVAYALKGAENSAEAMRGLGALAAADLLFRLGDKTILVEGRADEACIKKFAEILGYDLRGVRFHNCDGDAILQMTKLCMELKVNFVALLDNDNKFKDGEYRRRHTEYGGIIDDIIGDSKHCVFVGEGENGQIENLFSGKDFDKYCPPDMNGRRKLKTSMLKEITSKEDCEKKTLKNFENILIGLGLKKLNT